MKTETLIIGGGLSGLNLARQLCEAGRDFHLLEARDRFGGRILSETFQGTAFDLGPAWFWPGQPRMEALISELNLKRFDQYSQGALTFEDEGGRVERGRGFASMEGSYRLQGGLGALIEALVANLPSSNLSLSTQVVSLQKTSDGVAAKTSGGQRFDAQNVVLSLPPRLAGALEYSPALNPAAHQTMDATATWMAGQAKAVAVYKTAFWRDAGLSGDAMSRHGPMVEIHDASPATDGPYGLFGFIGVPAQVRHDNTAAMKEAVVAQLVRMFGPEAANPETVFFKDWAFDPDTSTETDLEPLYQHPTYGMPQVLSNIWNGRLIFSGTETGQMFGGYLEGALESAANALTLLETEKV
ncbi:MAG: FAD-dependent oxidoreductase [Cognatishimia sp.]|uniref:flavin monoamine oxidase family protein n=1 Tax=Cognatishimia sp. TaxID=2211648 RepID=UPI003B8AFFFF